MPTTPAVDPSSISNLISNSPWIYRSYFNESALVGNDPQKALALIFGEGKFILNVDDSRLTGSFSMSTDLVLDIVGALHFELDNAVTMLMMIGTGRAGTPTEGWQYDYQAFLSPSWLAAANQVPAFTGTVLRALPHNGQPAGVTASFILNAGEAALAALSVGTTFAKQIFPKFRAKDIKCMAAHGVELASATWMCDPAGGDEFADHSNARRVFSALSQGQMPPDQPWPQDWIAVYEQWINSGFQP
jgi:hypothetical protein